jgi:hypothetical protein
MRFYQALSTLTCPYRKLPRTLTPEGAVEIVMIFENEADIRLFQAWQQNPALDGVQA